MRTVRPPTHIMTPRRYLQNLDGEHMSTRRRDGTWLPSPQYSLRRYSRKQQPVVVIMLQTLSGIARSLFVLINVQGNCTFIIFDTESLRFLKNLFIILDRQS